jgi:hypothetical protein
VQLIFTPRSFVAWSQVLDGGWLALSSVQHNDIQTDIGVLAPDVICPRRQTMHALQVISIIVVSFGSGLAAPRAWKNLLERIQRKRQQPVAKAPQTTYFLDSSMKDVLRAEGIPSEFNVDEAGREIWVYQSPRAHGLEPSRSTVAFMGEKVCAYSNRGGLEGVDCKVPRTKEPFFRRDSALQVLASQGTPEEISLVMRGSHQAWQFKFANAATVDFDNVGMHALVIGVNNSMATLRLKEHVQTVAK